MEAVAGTGKRKRFSATTDAAGQFVIRNVEPGEYHAVAAHRGFVEGTYGPHPGPSGLLVLVPGEASKDVSFWLEPDAVISGHVYDGDGKPVERVVVQAWSYGYAFFEAHDWFPLLAMGPVDVAADVEGLDALEEEIYAPSLAPGANAGPYPMSLRLKDSQGEFDMPGVSPGSYLMRARLKDGDQWLSAVRRPVTVGNGDVNGVRLVLTPGPTITGSLETKGSIALPSLRVILAERHSAHIDWTHNEAATKPDGRFAFDGVPDDHYFLRISGLPQNVYVKSANLGGQDILDSGFEVSGGLAPGLQLKIVLDEDGGRLTGTVMLNDKPLSDALVTLLQANSSKRSSDWSCKLTRTDGSGNFAFAAIRPGEYRLFAWEKLLAGEGEARDPAFVDRFEDQGQEIQIDSGAALTLQLNAILASQTRAVEALLF